MLERLGCLKPFPSGVYAGGERSFGGQRACRSSLLGDGLCVRITARIDAEIQVDDLLRRVRDQMMDRPAVELEKFALLL
ncbi:MAG: hypothetical protein IT443_13340 [Phycisphaeraceae bacterium]|nr:hypothetical protein [Phycisphaeraceae bacterium]